MKKLALIIAALACLVLASSAAADVRVGPRFQYLYEGGGSHNWTNRLGDSPSDANAKALRARVSGNYLAFYTKNSLVIRKDVDAVSNLSFDFAEDRHVGAGSPRISVEFQNGDIGYLAAGACNHTLANTGGGWGRADFTRFKTNCTMYVYDGVTNTPYPAGAGMSAWDVYSTANPAAVVEKAYVVLDEPGRYLLDHISIGDGVMHTRADRWGKACPTEASC